MAIIMMEIEGLPSIKAYLKFLGLPKLFPTKTKVVHGEVELLEVRDDGTDEGGVLISLTWRWRWSRVVDVARSRGGKRNSRLS